MNLRNNALYSFYARYLMKRAIAAFDFTIPPEWSSSYFKYTMFCRGYGAILDYPKFGIIFQGGTLYGRDLYYQPKRFLLANPVLQSKDLPIYGSSRDPKCVVVKLQPDYSGLADVVDTYAIRLALAYEAWTMNTQNSKLSYVGMFDNKAAAKGFESLFDRVQSGEPAVAVGKSLFDEDGNPRWATFAQNLKANYIAPDMSDDIRKIMNEFNSFVGIPSNPEERKRERQVAAAVESNNVETDTLLDQMVRTVSEGFDQANEFYKDKLSVPLSVKKRYPTVETVGEWRGDSAN